MKNFIRAKEVDEGDPFEGVFRNSKVKGVEEFNSFGGSLEKPKTENLDFEFMPVVDTKLGDLDLEFLEAGFSSGKQRKVSE